MNEYLMEISCDEFITSDLSDEENMYVQAYLKVHNNRKNKTQKENIYNEGIYNDFYSTESKAATQRGIYHC